MGSRRYLPHPVLSVVLWLLWLTLWNSVTLGQALLGGLFAWSLPLLCKGLLPATPSFRRPGLMLRYLLRLGKDILVANFEVARLTLGPTARLQPAFIEYPLELNGDFAVWVLAGSVSVTPGTLSADLSPDGKRLLVHALHSDDPQALVAWIRHRYEEPLKEIFPCSTL